MRGCELAIVCLNFIYGMIMNNSCQCVCDQYDRIQNIKVI